MYLVNHVPKVMTPSGTDFVNKLSSSLLSPPMDSGSGLEIPNALWR